MQVQHQQFKWGPPVMLCVMSSSARLIGDMRWGFVTAHVDIIVNAITIIITIAININIVIAIAIAIISISIVVVITNSPS